MAILAAALQPGLARVLRHAAFGLCALTVGCSTVPLPPLESSRTPTGLSNSAAADAGGAWATLTLAVGDIVGLQVYGRPELAVTTTVAEDGTITAPLVGNVPVAGLTPARAGQRVAAAYQKGGFLLDPQVTLSLGQSGRGSQVSVLGAVKTPGRYVIEPRTTVLDALAQAGGITENGAGTVVLLRPDKTGKIVRYGIELKGLIQGRTPVPTLTLRGGDSLFVPPAEQFYIYGEVKAPNMYRLEPGMTVVHALSRSGGITPRGSSSRIEIRRRKPDGSYTTSSADLGDVLQADDVIRVKERIF
jgi:polysaccharide export outer membrane protein